MEIIVQQPRVLCRACNTDNNPADGVCQRCGTSLARTKLEIDECKISCPRCQNMNSAGCFFCYYCGKYFADTEEVTAGKTSQKTARALPQRTAAKAQVIMPGGAAITLTGLPVFIERSDFDSTLPHEILMSISRQHILITYSRGKYYIKDYGREGKGSTNHTKLNGVDIYDKKKKALKDGDKIELAGQPELTLMFRLLPESE